MTPRFGKVAVDYQKHRPVYAPALFAKLRAFGLGVSGQAILDLGAGSGRFGQGIGMPVVSVDPSLPMLQRASTQRVGARGEMLPFADETFDVVAAADCWHWMDRACAPREVLRVLKPGGMVTVVYQMHVPMPGSVAEVTEQLILRHKPSWAHANSAGINGQVLRDLQRTGFEGIESFSFDAAIAFSHDQWRGYVRTLSSVGASLSEEALDRFDREHADLLRDWPPQLEVPHRVFAVVARKPPRAL